ncbi:hypothetical protein DF3PA_20191 [Candidatus Defluviicoccus seviourii]|uniref:Uncharacterized protein n=1 Tax=Candidatus Defluviicoccus seviourii TaxID=2565273 RepID=A0A564WDA9_9PROT|nr:hypothetical protein DF3PA_20191 [Candidatus Defluviicoccus seviourii]
MRSVCASALEVGEALNFDADADRILQDIELLDPDPCRADTAVLQAHACDLLGERLDEIDVAAANDGTHGGADFLVTDDIRELIAELPVVAHGKIEVDAHPLRGAVLVPMDADPARQHEIANEHVADRVARIGNAQRLAERGTRRRRRGWGNGVLRTVLHLVTRRQREASHPRSSPSAGRHRRRSSGR